MPSAVDIVAQTDRLPSLPAAYLEVKRVIDDTNGSIRQLAAAMSSDAAMARCAEEARCLALFRPLPGRLVGSRRQKHANAQDDQQ